MIDVIREEARNQLMEELTADYDFPPVMCDEVTAPMMAEAWGVVDHIARSRLKGLVASGKLTCHQARGVNGNAITVYRKAGTN